MSNMDNHQTHSSAGGFLPSPAPSSASTPNHSSNMSSLPHPRKAPLKAGGTKEDAARRYVEEELLKISRRFAKKFQNADIEGGSEVRGYEHFGDVARDLSGVIDVVWLSGTPSLQIPYLMNIALSLTTYLPSFPASPQDTFSLLHKLDHVFSSLLKGHDITSQETLPGFENGLRKGFSRTDMVRLKGIVEDCRVVVVDVMTGVEGGGDESGMETGTETETEGERMDIDESHGARNGVGETDMEIAKVYEGTLVLLGELLGGDF